MLREWNPPLPKGAGRWPKTEYDAFRAAQKCGACGLQRTGDGQDPCIANLPGVNFACCGHGVKEGYVSFKNGLVIRGFFDGRPGGMFHTKNVWPLLSEALRRFRGGRRRAP